MEAERAQKGNDDKLVTSKNKKTWENNTQRKIINLKIRLEV